MFSMWRQRIRRLNIRNRAGILVPYVLIVTVSMAAAWLLVLKDGNIVPALAVILVVTILVATFYKAEWGFYLLFGMVMLFDQFLNTMPGGSPITYKVGYFLNLKQNPYLPPIGAAVMNPIEVQLFLILLAWFIAISARRANKLQGVPYWGLALLLFAAIAFSEVHGMVTGGTFLPSMWEIRALMYFLLLFFLVPQLIQTRKQMNIILWIFIAMIAVKASQGAWRFIELGFKFKTYTTLTNHEDPLFIADLLLFLLALKMFDVKIPQRRVLVWLLPVFFLGFYAGQRRAVYASLAIALILFVVMLKPEQRRKFIRMAIPILVLVAVYAAVFWNRPGRLGAPVRLLASAFSNTKKGAGDRYWSDLYRDYERYDLAITVRHFPLLGLGFGKKYLQPVDLALIGTNWSLRDWIPHDEILWILTKMGAVGFFIFFVFIDALVFEIGRMAKTLKDPYLRAVTFLIAAAIMGQIVVSYFDLQLTFYRNMILLGTLCGFLPTIKALDKKKEPHRARPILNSTESIPLEEGAAVK